MSDIEFKVKKGKGKNWVQSGGERVISSEKDVQKLGMCFPRTRGNPIIIVETRPSVGHLGKHVCRNSRVMYVASDSGAGKEAEDGEGPTITHCVNVQMRRQAT